MPNPGTELIAGELYIAYQHGWSTDEPTWAILTNDEAKAADLAARLGGRAREVPARAGATEVLLGRNAVEATLDAASAAVTRSGADQPGGSMRTCDQMVKARAGTGPRPDVSLLIRITGAEDLGMFRLTSTSWDFAESVHALAADADPVGHLVRVMVRIHTRRLTTRSGVAVVLVHPQLAALETLSENVRWSLAA